jgi:hypothetical protein
MNKMLTYPITEEAKGKELNIMQGILHNIEYNKNLSTRQPNQHKNNKNTDRQQKTKLAIFTYSGKETKKIMKLFKEIQIGIAFRTRNTIQNIVKPCPQMEQLQKKRLVPNEMYGLPTRIQKADRPNILYET